MEENLTETILQKSRNLDCLPTDEVLTIMNEEDQKVPQAVKFIIPKIAKVVNEITERLKKGGRLFYIGSGTSGRLGILDSAECPPTFGVSHEIVQGIIAGGNTAIIKAVEGAEDNLELAIADLKDKNFTEKDCLIGLTASGRTPYVISALKYAKSLGAFTSCITCNPGSAVTKECEIALVAEVGPEVLTGSTRLKAGTAQKLILNMISTTVMIKLGKTLGNLMVDLMPTNLKLKDRSKRILMEISGISEKKAEQLILDADGCLKTAIIMEKFNINNEKALQKLKGAGNILRNALFEV